MREPPLVASPSRRLLPLDTLRGLLMVVMALDHANTFISHGKRGFELWTGSFPEYYGDALAFLTRGVTHIAAPGFFFLMGAGMVLFAHSRRGQGWSTARIARHFALRAALLFFLQFCVENPAWRLGQPDNGQTYYGVLYALGGAMLIGILLLRLPQRWLIGLSVLLIGLTELLLPADRSGALGYASLLRLWLLPGYSEDMLVLYPLMPWLGVLGLGMAYGQWLERDRERAYRDALRLGAAALVLFVPLRLCNGFGNIRPMQGNDWIAFLNVVKYPPSLTFLLLTLGIDLVVLGLFAQAADKIEHLFKPLAVFGRVPLFFYVSHLYLYGLLGLWITTGIAAMYPYWLLGLMILFPLCWGYGRVKQSRPINSLWRSF